jgi:hypothetical protein
VTEVETCLKFQKRRKPFLFEGVRRFQYRQVTYMCRLQYRHGGYIRELEYIQVAYLLVFVGIGTSWLQFIGTGWLQVVGTCLQWYISQ